MTKGLLLTKFFVLILCSISVAQQLEINAIASAGESISTQDFIITHTIGELFVNSYESDASIVSEGFNQSNLYYIAGLAHGVDYKITLFPNPASDYLNITSDNLTIDEVTIYNSSGKLLSTHRDHIQIDVRGLATGTYIVNIITHKKNIPDSFKLIKK